MVPSAAFTTSVQVMKYAPRRRTSFPGARRKNFFGGSSMKSSRSMKSSFENGTWRTPAPASSGLFCTSTSSTTPSAQLVRTTLSGRKTAMRRCAVALRWLRTAFSRRVTSMTLSFLVTPISSQKARTASAV